MSLIDRWVDKLKGVEAIGGMSHWQRMEKAFHLEEPDMVPVAPELDYWQVYYAGYSQLEVFNDVDKCTDACIRTWASLRTDAIWMYVDLSHELDPLTPPERRSQHFIIRGPRDYVLYKPVAATLNEATKLFQEKVWERYGYGRASSHYIPHCMQLLEFQKRMGNNVPVIVGAATPSNHAETVVGAERFLRWLVTEPKERIREYLALVTEERLAALDGYREFAYKNGCEFFCCWGGARSWSLKQLEDFGEYDEIFLEKVRRIFHHPFWHICGHNLPQAMEWLAYRAQGIEAVQYDMPYGPLKMSWPEWFEFVAKLFKDRRCAMNSPTTQLALHGTPDEVQGMVKEFIKHTSPYTTCIVMPGCELSAYTPIENVESIIKAARTFGKYPIKPLEL